MTGGYRVAGRPVTAACRGGPEFASVDACEVPALETASTAVTAASTLALPYLRVRPGAPRRDTFNPRDDPATWLPPEPGICPIPDIPSPAIGSWWKVAGATLLPRWPRA